MQIAIHGAVIATHDAADVAYFTELQLVIMSYQEENCTREYALRALERLIIEYDKDPNEKNRNGKNAFDTANDLPNESDRIDFANLMQVAKNYANDDDI